MVDRIKDYLRSPKGRQQAARAQTMARDPQNRRKLREFVDRWRSGKTR